MKTTKVLTVLFLSLVVVAAKSQSIHIGATTGGNATFVLDKGLSEDPRYNSTATYGMTPVGFNFGVDWGKFGLSLESILSKQGQIYEMIDIAQKVQGSRKIDLSYVHLPLLMKFMSGGNSSVRTNFNIGPQLSLLTSAVETIQTKEGTYEIPDGMDFEGVVSEIAPAGEEGFISDNGNGTYTVSQDLSPKDVLSKKANDFANAEFQVAAAFGLDFDLSRHLFMSTQIRANYSITDMRNKDFVDAIENGQTSSLIGRRSNLLVGIQIGIHYTFGLTPSKKGTEARK